MAHGSENIVHYVRGDMAAGRKSQPRQWPRPHISADGTAEKENAGTGQLAFSFSLSFFFYLVQDPSPQGGAGHTQGSVSLRQFKLYGNTLASECVPP